MLEHIKDLGVTAIELLPVHTYVNDSFLIDRGLSNYWGYSSIGFFAPHPTYAADRSDVVKEFREMVSACHGAGIDVVLDVVYNHTAEGNEKGPTLSFKGIDNASYYQLLPDKPRYYINDTGTGNTFNLHHARVTQLVTDSLRYWVEEMGVDGFRFDLASTLGRGPMGFDRNAAIMQNCLFDPVLSQVKMIAEPWDIGPGGYQVGAFLPGWAEWNDKFRDDMRDFWRGAAPVTAITSRLCASAQTFNNQGRRPWSCVNLITAHDGFTLRDTVTYNGKHNEANGEDGNDGNSDNRSWNCGVEGPDRQQDHQCAAGEADAQFHGDAAARPGHADDRGRRRVRPHPERQQQRLLPGQRDQLGRLGLRRRRQDAARLHPQADDPAPQASGACAATASMWARPTSRPAPRT